MSKSDYQKYLKYKKKYLTIKKHLRGGGECIEENESDVFINAVNKKYLPSIKSLPEDRADSYPAMNGYPKNKRQQAIFNDQFKDILKFLKKGNILNLTLQTNLPIHDITKHSILLYYDLEDKTLELWDSNGYKEEGMCYDYVTNMLDYLIQELDGECIIGYTELEDTINHFGGGHCDALSLFYAILRQEGCEKAQTIYTINWENKENIKRLNTYIKQNKIEALKNFKNNGFILN